MKTTTLVSNPQQKQFTIQELIEKHGLSKYEEGYQKQYPIGWELKIVTHVNKKTLEETVRVYTKIADGVYQYTRTQKQS